MCNAMVPTIKKIRDDNTEWMRNNGVLYLYARGSIDVPNFIESGYMTLKGGQPWVCGSDLKYYTWSHNTTVEGFFATSPLNRQYTLDQLQAAFDELPKEEQTHSEEHTVDIDFDGPGDCNSLKHYLYKLARDYYFDIIMVVTAHGCTYLSVDEGLSCDDYASVHNIFKFKSELAMWVGCFGIVELTRQEED